LAFAALFLANAILLSLGLAFLSLLYVIHWMP